MQLGAEVIKLLLAWGEGGTVTCWFCSTRGFGLWELLVGQEKRRTRRGNPKQAHWRETCCSLSAQSQETGRGWGNSMSPFCSQLAGVEGGGTTVEVHFVWNNTEDKVSAKHTPAETGPLRMRSQKNFCSVSLVLWKQVYVPVSLHYRQPVSPLGMLPCWPWHSTLHALGVVFFSLSHTFLDPFQPSS